MQDPQGKQSNSDPMALWQFRVSMYPEKVRWALDYKGIPHIRHSLLPGPHAAQLLLRFGQKEMPVITHAGNTVKGSAAIIDYVEQHFPQQPLYPANLALKQQALDMQQRCDGLGPYVRRAFFYQFLAETDYATSLFTTGYPAWAQRLYRSTFPVTRSIMQMDMHISRGSAEEGCLRTQEALDFVATQCGPEGYLVGDQFSIADIAAATLLFCVVLPEEYPVAFTRPLPRRIQDWLQHWQEHPGAAWVREIYRKHRGQSCAVEDRNG